MTRQPIRFENFEVKFGYAAADLRCDVMLLLKVDAKTSLDLVMSPAAAKGARAGVDCWRRNGVEATVAAQQQAREVADLLQGPLLVTRHSQSSFPNGASRTVRRPALNVR